MLGGLPCLIAIGESEQKYDGNICHVLWNQAQFYKGKISHFTYFSNVLYLIAIDRRLQNKITNLQKWLNS